MMLRGVLAAAAPLLLAAGDGPPCDLAGNYTDMGSHVHVVIRQARGSAAFTASCSGHWRDQPGTVLSNASARMSGHAVHYTTIVLSRAEPGAPPCTMMFFPRDGTHWCRQPFCPATPPLPPLPPPPPAVRVEVDWGSAPLSTTRLAVGMEIDVMPSTATPDGELEAALTPLPTQPFFVVGVPRCLRGPSQSRVCTGTHFHIPAGTVTPAEGHYGVPTLTAQNYSVGWAHDGAWKLLRELGPGLFSRAAVWWTYPLTGIAELSEGEWDFAGMTSYLKDFHAAIDGQDRVVGPAISSVRESDAFSICRAVSISLTRKASPCRSRPGCSTTLATAAPQPRASTPTAGSRGARRLARASTWRMPSSCAIRAARRSRTTSPVSTTDARLQTEARCLVCMSV